jgi:hypothetical protein
VSSTTSWMIGMHHGCSAGSTFSSIFFTIWPEAHAFLIAHCPADKQWCKCCLEHPPMNVFCSVYPHIKHNYCAHCSMPKQHFFQFAVENVF